MESRHEERIRFLENDRLVAKAREDHQREIDERNRRRRTELIAWIALVISIASIVINAIDKLA